MATSQLELEKLIALGKDLDLKGTELRDWVDEQRDVLKRERDEERALRVKQREEERQQQQIEREEERQQQQIEREEERQQQQIERDRAEDANREKVKQLELQKEIEVIKRDTAAATAAGHKGNNTGNGQGHKSRAPKLPPFRQDVDDIDSYINRFERYATSQGWDRNTEWANSLAALIQGNGLFEYASLSIEESQDYDRVKQSVLGAYQLTADGFRKKFRETKPTQDDTGTKFVSKLSNYMKRWLELERVDTFEELQDLILREQFTDMCTRHHATFLKERNPVHIKEMGRYADQYIEAHGGWFNNSSKGKSNSKPNESRNIYINSNHNKNYPEDQNQGKTNPSPNYKGKNSSNNRDSSERRCFLCDKPGHYARDCRSKSSMAFLTEVVDEMVEKRRTQTSTDFQCKNNDTTQHNTNVEVGSCMMVIKPDKV